MAWEKFRRNPEEIQSAHAAVRKSRMSWNSFRELELVPLVAVRRFLIDGIENGPVNWKMVCTQSIRLLSLKTTKMAISLVRGRLGVEPRS
jgi:hypothetical protein